MADLIIADHYPPYAYTTPEAWDGYGMDWEYPDPTNPSFYDALWRAVWERTAVAGVGAYTTFGFYNIHINAWTRARPYTAAWSQELGARILGLTTVFVVINPDTDKRAETPYVTVRDLYMNSTRTRDLSITGGDLLTGPRTIAFLKSAKYFLDLMTITTVNPEMNDVSPSDMFVTSDYYANQMDRDYFDTHDPYDAGNWSTWFNWCKGGAVVTPDVRVTNTIGGVFTGWGGANGAFLRCDVDVYYRNQSALAHNLLMQFSADVNDSESGIYSRPWDYLGLAGTELRNGVVGDMIKIAVGRDIALVGVGNSVGGSITPLSAPVEPTAYTDFTPYSGDPPEPDPYPPYYGNVIYNGRYDNFAYDYGVTDGFKFRIITGEIP